MPLGCIYVLAGGPEPYIKPLSTKEALLHVLPHWYGALFDGELLDTFGLDTHFRECADLVKAVPAYVVERPADIDLLGDSVRMVECHFMDLAVAREPGTR